MAFKVVLFYRYMKIDDPDSFASVIKAICLQLDILGRVLVAMEGLNGTLSGTVSKVDDCIQRFIDMDSRLLSTDWKTSISDSVPFLDLSIKVVKEIISSGREGVQLNEFIRFDSNTFGGIRGTGKHLSPIEFHNGMIKDDSSCVIDVRNEFEFDIGHFKDAVGLGTYNYAETFKALDVVLREKGA